MLPPLFNDFTNNRQLIVDAHDEFTVSVLFQLGENVPDFFQTFPDGNRYNILRLSRNRDVAPAGIRRTLAGCQLDNVSEANDNITVFVSDIPPADVLAVGVFCPNGLTANS